METCKGTPKTFVQLHLCIGVSFLALHFWRYIFGVTFLALHFWRYIFGVTFLALHFWRYIFVEGFEVVDTTKILKKS
jgi:hypothetical protein